MSTAPAAELLHQRSVRQRQLAGDLQFAQGGVLSGAQAVALLKVEASGGVDDEFSPWRGSSMTHK